MPESDHVTGPAGAGPARSGPPKAGLLVAIVLVIGTILLTCVTGGIVWLTGGWDGPSSDDPAESVDGFLTALLDDRDQEAALGYTCTSRSGPMTEVFDLVDGLPASGTDGGMADFSWDDIAVTEQSGRTAVVTADVMLDITGVADTWTFAMVTGDPDSAWRVCGVNTGDSAGS